MRGASLISTVPLQVSSVLFMSHFAYNCCKKFLVFWFQVGKSQYNIMYKWFHNVILDMDDIVYFT